MNFPLKIKLSLAIALIAMTLNDLAAQTFSPSFSYTIPIGQTLYTTDTKDVKDLQAYQLEYQETFGTQTTQVIEMGDFVIKDQIVAGKKVRDTLYFAVSTLKITGQDTLREFRKLELGKKTTYSIDAKASFQQDRIYFKQSPKFSPPTYVLVPKKKTYVHPNDRELYFKLDDGANFKFQSKGVSVSIISIPFRARLFSTVDTISTTSEFRLNNLELFVGYKHSFYNYKENKLRKNAVSLGTFAGPTIIKLNSSNSNTESGETISKLGLTYGLGIMGEFNRLNIGMALGFEFLPKNEDHAWAFNQRPYWGVIFGFSLN